MSLEITTNPHMPITAPTAGGGSKKHADHINRENQQRQEFNKPRYIKIVPDDIDFTCATKIKRRSDVYAVKVMADNAGVKVTNSVDGHIESISSTREGDWIVYDIGVVNPKEITDYEKMSDDEIVRAQAAIAPRQVYSQSSFEQLYTSKRPVDTGFVAKPIDKEISVFRVPFDFVIHNHWMNNNKGGDQFIKAGGGIVQTETGHYYGIANSVLDKCLGNSKITEIKFKTPDLQKEYDNAASYLRVQEHRRNQSHER